MDFHDKLALIIGGSSGIGLATARLLAARGAAVWLVARDRTRLALALEQVRAAGLSAGARPTAASRPGHGMIAADVSDPAQAAHAVASVADAVGTPDLVINSAGVVHPRYFQDLDLVHFRQQMDINYFGTIHVIKAVAPGMVARGSGHIVNICSAAGFMNIAGYTAYGASKYAVRGFSDALRMELKPAGIGVSVVFPPDTDTPQLDLDKRLRPPEVDALAAGIMLSADAVARAILAGVAHGRYIITPGWQTGAAYRLLGLLGPLQYPLLDLLVARARVTTRH